MNVWVIAANILGWPVIHVVVARIVLGLPLERFAATRLTAPGSRVREADFYRNILHIQLWKARLPDGAPWLGGFSKKRFTQRESNYIRTFILETRRAEFAHWCMLLCFPIFFLWNPPWARVVMTIYAVVANLPCILAQRYNRIMLARLLVRLNKRACTPA